MAARLRNAARRRSPGSFALADNSSEASNREVFPQVFRELTLAAHRQSPSMSRVATRGSRRARSSPSLRRIPFFANISGIGASDPTRLSSRKKSHYYQIKVLPTLTAGKGIKLEVLRGLLHFILIFFFFFLK
ncbi:unnamed protein product [Gongylonema pulchrum]|uniref:Uncharacterized protein n=1 Tax=Gongylonema pulchrum TaxID=637853 RepID=A0A183D846_9BILA|nr:unnamed protein product [Gongylonema pulchrum]